MAQHLVLASASPQRKRLLEGLGLTFEIHPSSIDEAQFPEKDPLKRSQILAHAKAKDVASRFPDSHVIGCDTLVVAADGSLLEKAKDAAEAKAMVQKLSSNDSVVHSALCIYAPGGTCAEDVHSSTVRFKKLSPEEIDWWISSGLWKDRSGSFQIDGPGQLLIEHLEGDWTSVVGLPVFALGQLLQKTGYAVRQNS